MVNVTTSGPFLDFNSNDHAALVVIVAVFFCLLMITVMVAKVFIRRHIRIALQDFDLILFLAALLMLAQTICIVYASEPGIGKHLTDVVSHVETIRKVSPRNVHAMILLLLYAHSSCSSVPICGLSSSSRHHRMHEGLHVPAYQKG